MLRVNERNGQVPALFIFDQSEYLGTFSIVAIDDIWVMPCSDQSTAMAGMGLFAKISSRLARWHTERTQYFGIILRQNILPRMSTFEQPPIPRRGIVASVGQTTLGQARSWA
jgi:hypothetical protein